MNVSMRLLLTILILLLIPVAAHAQNLPSCAKLNQLWKTKYFDDFGIQDWKKDTFKCPSEEANVAGTFYLLDTLDIIDKNGNEVVDYYGEFARKIDLTFRNPVPYSQATDGILLVGSDLYGGNAHYAGANVLVHETRHLEKGYDPDHLRCTHGFNKGLEPAQCDEYWCGEGKKLNAAHSSYCDKSKGGSGYNLGLRYYLDLYHYTYGHSLTKKELRYAIRHVLDNRFNHVSKSQRQHIERMLKR